MSNLNLHNGILATVLVVAYVLISVECTHFRGGVISWRALDTSPLPGTTPTVSQIVVIKVVTSLKDWAGEGWGVVYTSHNQ